MFYIIGSNIYIIQYDPTISENFILYSYSLTAETWTLLTDSWAGAGTSYIDGEKGYCYLRNKGFFEYDLKTNGFNLVKPVKFENEETCIYMAETSAS